jgi:lincosamide nucleotidyltransferase A/C/D/E
MVMMSDRDVLEILDARRAAGVRLWIGGGWGIDALIGTQTRDHDDLDLAIDAREEDVAVAILGGRGFEVAEDQRPVRVELRDRADRRVDLHPVHFDDDGDGVQASLERDPLFHYPREALAKGAIGGRTVPCISADLQLEFHGGYEPTDKDRRDVANLCAKLGLESPLSYRSTGGRLRRRITD